MSISAIEQQIVAVVSGVVSIKKTYTYPVAEIGRLLPALVVVYDGFSQEPAAGKSTDTAWRFEFTLFLPAEGKTLEKNWADMKTLVPALLTAFRANPGLNGACWTSIIEAGDPIIHIPGPAEQPQFIGHSFRLVAKKEE